MICVLLYFIEWFCWSVYWIYDNARYDWHEISRTDLGQDTSSAEVKERV